MTPAEKKVLESLRQTSVLSKLSDDQFALLVRQAEAEGLSKVSGYARDLLRAAAAELGRSSVAQSRDGGGRWAGEAAKSASSQPRDRLGQFASTGAGGAAGGGPKPAIEGGWSEYEYKGGGREQSRLRRADGARAEINVLAPGRRHRDGSLAENARASVFAPGKFDSSASRSFSNRHDAEAWAHAQLEAV